MPRFRKHGSGVVSTADAKGGQGGGEGVRVARRRPEKSNQPLNHSAGRSVINADLSVSESRKLLRAGSVSGQR